MKTQTIRDLLWIWGMEVNALQKTGEYGKLGFGTSTMTVEDAIHRTGITNIYVAGHLPLEEKTLAEMPSARRIVLKSGIHNATDGPPVIDRNDYLEKLRKAKHLSAIDNRAETFHMDDFSVTSINAKVTAEHMADFQHANVSAWPQLPVGMTVYPPHLDRPELPAFFKYFSYFMLPLWHGDQIETLPAVLERLSKFTGGKPVVACLYVYDFGNQQLTSRESMAKQLEVTETMLRKKDIAGLCILGTCMMDLDWESNHYFYEWLDRVGDQTI